MQLDQKSIAVSSGSACAAGSNDPSHVLLAIGVSADVAQTSVRFSFSHHTTAAELQKAAQSLAEAVAVFIKP